RNFLRKATERGVDILLPVDVIAAESLDAAAGEAVAVGDLAGGHMALDIGPKTTARYAEVIERARTIFWNGPMGVFEKAPFAAGTVAVARAVADNRLAFS